jgi:hypothetical protein
MRLNAKRGLFRLWLVVAVLWVIAAGIWLRPDQAILHLLRGPSQDELAVWPFACDLSKPDEKCLSLISMWPAFNRPDYVAQETAEMRSAWHVSLVGFAGWAIGPAVAVLMIGSALLWAIGGFRD